MTKRNSIYVTFQPPNVIVSTEQHHMVLSDEQARELWGKLVEAYGTPSPPPDTTLAPADCEKCTVPDRDVVQTAPARTKREPRSFPNTEPHGISWWQEEAMRQWKRAEYAECGLDSQSIKQAVQEEREKCALTVHLVGMTLHAWEIFNTSVILNKVAEGIRNRKDK
jgi:hypothetical protein